MTTRRSSAASRYLAAIDCSVPATALPAPLEMPLSPPTTRWNDSFGSEQARSTGNSPSSSRRSRASRTPPRDSIDTHPQPACSPFRRSAFFPATTSALVSAKPHARHAHESESRKVPMLPKDDGSSIETIRTSSRSSTPQLYDEDDDQHPITRYKRANSLNMIENNLSKPHASTGATWRRKSDSTTKLNKAVTSDSNWIKKKAGPRQMGKSPNSSPPPQEQSTERTMNDASSAPTEVMMNLSKFRRSPDQLTDITRASTEVVTNRAVQSKSKKSPKGDETDSRDVSEKLPQHQQQETTNSDSQIPRKPIRKRWPPVPSQSDNRKSPAKKSFPRLPVEVKSLISASSNDESRDKTPSPEVSNFPVGRLGLHVGTSDEPETKASDRSFQSHSVSSSVGVETGGRQISKSPEALKNVFGAKKEIVRDPIRKNVTERYGFIRVVNKQKEDGIIGPKDTSDVTGQPSTDIIDSPAEAIPPPVERPLPLQVSRSDLQIPLRPTFERPGTRQPDPFASKASNPSNRFMARYPARSSPPSENKGPHEIGSPQSASSGGWTPVPLSSSGMVSEDFRLDTDVTQRPVDSSEPLLPLFLADRVNIDQSPFGRWSTNASKSESVDSLNEGPPDILRVTARPRSVQAVTQNDPVTEVAPVHPIGKQEAVVDDSKLSPHQNSPTRVFAHGRMRRRVLLRKKDRWPPQKGDMVEETSDKPIEPDGGIIQVEMANGSHQSAFQPPIPNRAFGLQHSLPQRRSVGNEINGASHEKLKVISNGGMGARASLGDTSMRVAASTKTLPLAKWNTQSTENQSKTSDGSRNLQENDILVEERTEVSAPTEPVKSVNPRSSVRDRIRAFSTLNGTPGNEVVAKSSIVAKARVKRSKLDESALTEENNTKVFDDSTMRTTTAIDITAQSAMGGARQIVSDIASSGDRMVTTTGVVEGCYRDEPVADETFAAVDTVDQGRVRRVNAWPPTKSNAIKTHGIDRPEVADTTTHQSRDMNRIVNTEKVVSNVTTNSTPRTMLVRGATIPAKTDIVSDADKSTSNEKERGNALVDVQSIRSMFESSRPCESDHDDEDDSTVGSIDVQSIRSIFETPPAKDLDSKQAGKELSGVSKMRAMYETSKEPAGKRENFVGNSNLKDTWTKFESTGSRLSSSNTSGKRSSKLLQSNSTGVQTEQTKTDSVSSRRKPVGEIGFRKRHQTEFLVNSSPRNQANSANRAESPVDTPSITSGGNTKPQKPNATPTPTIAERIRILRHRETELKSVTTSVGRNTRPYRTSSAPNEHSSKPIVSGESEDPRSLGHAVNGVSPQGSPKSLQTTSSYGPPALDHARTSPESAIVRPRVSTYLSVRDRINALSGSPGSKAVSSERSNKSGMLEHTGTTSSRDIGILFETFRSSPESSHEGRQMLSSPPRQSGVVEMKGDEQTKLDPDHSRQSSTMANEGKVEYFMQSDPVKKSVLSSTASGIVITKKALKSEGSRGSVDGTDSEYDDGVTLDLSIAEISGLTNPTCLRSKEDGNEFSSEGGDSSERTSDGGGVDVTENDGRGPSEASSSQTSEAAAPLIALSMRMRFSDDASTGYYSSKSPTGKAGPVLQTRWGPLSGARDETAHANGKEEETAWNLENINTSFPVKDPLHVDPGLHDSLPRWKRFQSSSWDTPPPFGVDWTSAPIDDFFSTAISDVLTGLVDEEQVLSPSHKATPTRSNTMSNTWKADVDQSDEVSPNRRNSSMNRNATAVPGVGGSPPSGQLFRRTHPKGSQETWQKRAERATAGSMTPQPGESRSVERQPPYGSPTPERRVLFSTTPATPQSSPTNFRPAIVPETGQANESPGLSKHAALMMKLRSLKESRMRRTATTGFNRNTTVYPATASPAAADRSRIRQPSLPPVGARNSSSSALTPFLRPNFVGPRQSRTAYANKYMDRRPEQFPAGDDEHSASTKSSTRFGGHNFDDCLELD